MKLQLFLILAMSMPLFAQTATFTTQGGGASPLHFNVISETYQGNVVANSGSVEISEDYGYPNSGIILPFNPTASGEYLNPIITITNTNTTYNGTVSRTTTYTFDSKANPQYGYYWSGTFTGTELCTLHRYGRCTNYGAIGDGSGTMTAMAVN